MDATPAAPDRAAASAPVELDVVVPCDPARAFSLWAEQTTRWDTLVQAVNRVLRPAD